MQEPSALRHALLPEVWQKTNNFVPQDPTPERNEFGVELVAFGQLEFLWNSAHVLAATSVTKDDKANLRVVHSIGSVFNPLCIAPSV